MPIIKQGKVVETPQGEIHTLDSFLETAPNDIEDARQEYGPQAVFLHVYDLDSIYV